MVCYKYMNRFVSVAQGVQPPLPTEAALDACNSVALALQNLSERHAGLGDEIAVAEVHLRHLGRRLEELDRYLLKARHYATLGKTDVK